MRVGMNYEIALFFQNSGDHFRLNNQQNEEKEECSL
jgi:hypothetical protein